MKSIQVTIALIILDIPPLLLVFIPQNYFNDVCVLACVCRCPKRPEGGAVSIGAGVWMFVSPLIQTLRSELQF